MAEKFVRARFQGECTRVYISHASNKPVRKRCGARVPFFYEYTLCHECLLELIAK